MTLIDSSFLWGRNWTVYNLATNPAHAMWLVDDAIWHGGDARACFRELGSMRVNITIDLWNSLGLRSRFPNGWLLADQSLPDRSLLPRAFSNRMADKHIMARAILPRTIECTCDANGLVIKQFVQEIGEEKIPAEKGTHLFDNATIQKTSNESSEIFLALRQLCRARGILGIDGLRITWGITAEENILTPIGGFGLPDHARYFLKEEGPEYILDRRFVKRAWQHDIAHRDERARSGRIAVVAKDLEKRYTVCHASLMAQ